MFFSFAIAFLISGILTIKINDEKNTCSYFVDILKDVYVMIFYNSLINISVYCVPILCASERYSLMSVLLNCVSPFVLLRICYLCNRCFICYSTKNINIIYMTAVALFSVFCLVRLAFFSYSSYEFIFYCLPSLSVLLSELIPIKSLSSGSICDAIKENWNEKFSPEKPGVLIFSLLSGILLIVFFKANNGESETILRYIGSSIGFVSAPLALLSMKIMVDEI